jgi:Spy/CpxP family protein refolding chaperone
MKKQFIQFAVVGALAAGLAFAQAPAPAPDAQGSANVGAGAHGILGQRLAQAAQQLNLTDAQKQEARLIFQQAFRDAAPVRAQLRQNRLALAAAVKAGQDNDQIQRLAKTQGNLMGQMVTIRTEAAAAFYANLTPEQKAKADQMQQQFRQKVRSRLHPSNG